VIKLNFFLFFCHFPPDWQSGWWTRTCTSGHLKTQKKKEKKVSFINFITFVPSEPRPQLRWRRGKEPCGRVPDRDRSPPKRTGGAAKPNPRVRPPKRTGGTAKPSRPPCGGGKPPSQAPLRGRRATKHRPQTGGVPEYPVRQIKLRNHCGRLGYTVDVDVEPYAADLLR
jgi:hypothetical protein